MRQDLSLQAVSGNWRVFTARKADKAFLPFRKRVLERDQHRCQYCGFQAASYQEVVNVDGDYANNKLSNLTTACCFCSQCLFLESVGMGEYGGGSLIYLPEMTQAELNGLCHVIFCAIANNTAYKSSAQTLYRSYKFRSQLVEDKYGEGSSNPAIFGQMVIDLMITDFQVTQQLFQDLRLLPARAKFRAQIEEWAAAAKGELVTDTTSPANQLPESVA